MEKPSFVTPQSRPTSTPEYWQLQQGSGEGSGEGGEGSGCLWCRVFWRRLQRRFQKALVQSQVRFNGFRRRFRRRLGRLWCRAMSGSTGFRRRLRGRSGRLVQSQVSSTGSSSTGFRRRFQWPTSQTANYAIAKRDDKFSSRKAGQGLCK